MSVIGWRWERTGAAQRQVHVDRRHAAVGLVLDDGLSGAVNTTRTPTTWPAGTEPGSANVDGPGGVPVPPATHSLSSHGTLACGQTNSWAWVAPAGYCVTVAEVKSRYSNVAGGRVLDRHDGDLGGARGLVDAAEVHRGGTRWDRRRSLTGR